MEKNNCLPLIGLSQFLAEKHITSIDLAVCGSNTIAFTAPNFYLPFFYFIQTDTITLPTPNHDQYSNITAIDISPDDQFVVTSHSNHQINLWDLRLRLLAASLILTADVMDSDIQGEIITNISIQNDLSALFISLSNNVLIHLEVPSIMNYLTIQISSHKKYPNQILGLKSASSFDYSMNVLAVILEDSVILADPENQQLTELAIIHTKSPKIAVTFHDWTFFIAIYSLDCLTIYEFEESFQEKKIIFNNKIEIPIKFIDFITPIHFCIGNENVIQIYHVSGKQLYVFQDLPSSGFQKVCFSSKGIFFLPISKIELTTWQSKLNKLIKKKKNMDAIQFTMKLYKEDSDEFFCEGKLNQIRDSLKSCLKYYFAQQSIDTTQLNIVASIIVEADLGDFIIREIFPLITNKTKNNFLGTFETTDNEVIKLLVIAILDAATMPMSTIQEFVKYSLKFIGKDTKYYSYLEDLLMKLSLPPSFTEEAVSIAISKHFYRFIIKHFDNVYNDIFPIFPLVIDSCDVSELANICNYIFLSNNIDLTKTNNCIVWLFSQKVKHLKRIFESGWDLAPKLLNIFFERTPINVLSGSNLSKSYIIYISLLSFIDAPKGKADNLFELLAIESLSENVMIPKESLNTILLFIFESDVSKNLRQKLYLRIIDKDFRNMIKVEDHINLCITSGFSDAIKRLEIDEYGYEPIITSMLLSDKPNEAIEFLENDEINHNDAEKAICTRFLALLFLEPRRLVKLLLTKFRDIHPSLIQTINNTMSTVLYYNQLFDIDNLSTEDDATYYINFLIEKDPKELLKFIRQKKPISDQITFNLCQSKSLHIGCAIVNTMRNEWNDAFVNYSKHLQQNNNYNIFDESLSLDILKHIPEIDSQPSNVIRIVLQPIVFGAKDSSIEFVKKILNLSTSIVNKFDVLLAVLPLTSNCDSKIKTILMNYINSVGCCCSIDPNTDDKFINTLERITQKCKRKCLGNDKFSVRSDEKNGVTFLSAPSEKCTDFIDPETAKDAMSVFQRAESVLFSTDIKIPQDHEATIVLMVSPH